MPTLSANAVKLYYETAGQGQALVLIHGLGSSTHDWDNQIAAFSKDYQVITFDLRGHGQSDKPQGPYTMAMFAADLDGLLAGLGVKQAHVVGISLGGAVAFQFALDHPNAVKTLTIVNSGPSMGVTPEQARQEIERRVGLVQQHGMRAMGEALAPNLFPDPDHATLRQMFVEAWAANDPAAYIEATRSMQDWNVTDRIHSIQCPALILTSDQDYTPVALKEAYAKLMPHAELVVIPNAHHAAPIERPEAFNTALGQFLSGHR